MAQSYNKYIIFFLDEKKIPKIAAPSTVALTIPQTQQRLGNKKIALDNLGHNNEQTVDKLIINPIDQGNNKLYP